MFYQYTEILNEAVDKDFITVRESEELLGGAETDLAVYKLNAVLEEFYKKDKENFDIDLYKEELSKNDIDIDEKFILSTANGLYKAGKYTDSLKEYFLQDMKTDILFLHGQFLKYMYEKGFSFYLTATIWHNINSLWENNKNPENPDINTYFTIHKKDFENHLAKLTAYFFVDNSSEMIATLWGSVYIYEFLKNHGIITQSIFDEFLRASKILKGDIIVDLTADLWRSNFVHCWEKPDCIPENEFREEDKIFRKSFHFKNQEFKEFKQEITEELSNIGELSDYIEASAEKEKPIPKTMFELFDQGNDDYDDSTVIHGPTRSAAKIGKNEPCPCGSGKKYKKCCGRNINQ